jgi:hypothetical protein
MTEAVHNAVETVAEITSESETPRWAVLSFDKVEAGNLSYPETLGLLSELDAKGTAGL